MSLAEIALLWELEIKEAKKLSDSATLLITNKENKYVLKKKRDLATTENELRLLDYLNDINIPVHLPIARNNGSYIYSVKDEIYCIYNYLNGGTFSALDCLQTEAAPILIGKTIAMLHQGMKNAPNANRFNKKDLYKDVYGFAIKEIETSDCDHNLSAIWNNIESSIKSISTKLPIQLIHRDSHIFNIIYSQNQLSGVIDFEIAEVNVRLFDICYCSTSILNEIFKKEDLRQLWISFVVKLVYNYNLYNQLDDVEIKSIWYLMLSIQTIFMAYFINDSDLYNTNKEMFIWLYEHKELIESSIVSSMIRA